MSCPVCDVGVLPNGWMDQDATTGTEVGLGPGDIVLDGDPAPPKRGQWHVQHPHFSAHLLIVAKCPRGPLSQQVLAVAEMGDRSATIDMGRKLGALPPLGGRELGGANVYTLFRGSWDCWVPNSPSNIMLPGPRPTTIRSRIFIHPAVWPQ